MSIDHGYDSCPCEYWNHPQKPVRVQLLSFADTKADPAGCEELQSVHLAEALHASQPSEADDFEALQILFEMLSITPLCFPTIDVLPLDMLN